MLTIIHDPKEKPLKEQFKLCLTVVESGMLRCKKNHLKVAELSFQETKARERANFSHETPLAFSTREVFISQRALNTRSELLCSGCAWRA